MAAATTKEPHLFKYIIIGDTEVGKSSLMLMFTERHFGEAHDMTIGPAPAPYLAVPSCGGVEFDSRAVKLAGGEAANLEIWDTAGQESYLSITRSYYRGTDCCLLVYDVTRRESFDHLGRWLQEARQNAANPDLVLMLVGNKADLESKRQISRAEGKAFADLHGMLFVELSAKNEKLVESVFVESAQRVLNVRRDNPRQRGPNIALAQPSRRTSDYDYCGCG